MVNGAGVVEGMAGVDEGSTGVVRGIAGVDEGSPGVVKGMAVVDEESPGVVEGFGVVALGVVEGICVDDVGGTCVVVCKHNRTCQIVSTEHAIPNPAPCSDKISKMKLEPPQR